jgi:hypothetical protein
MIVTSKRLPNGEHAILCGGVRVGEAWRYPPRASGSQRRAAAARFGLRMDGVLWRDGDAVRRGGGFTTTSVARLCDAVALASKVLSRQRRAA